MSRLAKDYIDHHFHVAQPISNLERELSNGFVLLHLCNQSGLLSDETVGVARNDSNPAAIIKNFKILTEALGSVSINVSKSDVANIMSEVTLFTHSHILK